jgi:hypothetical protein
MTCQRTEPQALKRAISGQLSGLREKMMSLEQECYEAKTELRKVLRDNVALTWKLNLRPPKYRGIPNIDLPSLRRQLTFYCHPDRGGDGELMRRIIELFDFLLASEYE